MDPLPATLKHQNQIQRKIESYGEHFINISKVRSKVVGGIVGGIFLAAAVIVGLVFIILRLRDRRSFSNLNKEEMKENS